MLTDAQKEALKNGASMEEVLAMAGPSDTEATAAAAAAQAAQAEAAAKTTEAPTIEGLKASVAEMTTKLADAEGQLAAKTTELTEATGKVTQLTAQVAASDAGVTALAAALTPYVERMGTALGKKVETKGMSASALVEAHAAMAADFAKSFPAGKRSKSTTAEDQTKAAMADQISMAAAKDLKF